MPHVEEFPTPTIHRLKRQSGIAGQFEITATVEYPGEGEREVTFVGSTYGVDGPVVMISDGRQTFVSDPGRFGEFNEAWVRAFFARA
jgi:hypothetical protein